MTWVDCKWWFEPEFCNFCNFHRKRTRIYCEWSLCNWTNTECLQIFTCVFARTQKKTESCLPLINKCIVYFNKMFCWKSFLLIFVSLSIHICVWEATDARCAIKDNLLKRVEIWYAKGLHQQAVNFRQFLRSSVFFGKWLIGNHVILSQKTFVFNRSRKKLIYAKTMETRQESKNDTCHS